jgi:N-methylhydantoinase B
LLCQGRIPASLEEIQARREPLQDEMESYLGLTDAYFVYWQGGGGYGDPTLRDPELVAQDVRDQRVSEQVAGATYGVVLHADGGVDLPATEQRRSAIRAERREHATHSTNSELAANGPSGPILRRLDDNVVVSGRDGESVIACNHCGYVLGPLGGDYLSRLARWDRPVREAGPHLWPEPATYVDTNVVFRQHYCPNCFTAFLSRVVTDR